jgi:hypothetical protein
MAVYLFFLKNKIPFIKMDPLRNLRSRGIALPLDITPKKKTPMEERAEIESILSRLKRKDLLFVDPLENASTKIERERFKKYRLPVSKYIERLPKSKQYALRTSPKKQKPASPKKQPSPKTTVLFPINVAKKQSPKKINYSKEIDNLTNDLIEKIYVIVDLAKSSDSKSTINKTAEFFDSVKDEISSFKSQM